MSKHISLAIAILFATLVSAWDPSKRTCRYSSLCLTSFVWFDSESGDRHYPDNVYPQQIPGHGSSAFPTLIWNETYELTFRSEITDYDKYPVTLQWWFPDIPKLNGTDKNEHNISSSIVWETNVTSNTASFTPSMSLFSDRLDSGLDPKKVLDLGASLSFLSIVQHASDRKDSTELARKNGRNDSLADNSQEFYVAPPFVKSAIDLARRDERNAWRHKMALGVGLSSGLSVLITYLVTWAAAQYWARRETRKYGEEKGLGARRWWIGF